jgi:hypothetical protein
MISAALRLSGHQHGTGNRLRRSAHALGWGGHFRTKSRSYSTAFNALRHARQQHRRQQRYPAVNATPEATP